MAEPATEHDIEEQETSSAGEDGIPGHRPERKEIDQDDDDSDASEFDEARALYLDKMNGRGECCVLAPDSFTRALWDLLLMIILLA